MISLTFFIYFIIKIQYVAHKICVNQWLSVRFPVSRQLLELSSWSVRSYLWISICAAVSAPTPVCSRVSAAESTALGLAGYRLRVGELR